MIHKTKAIALARIPFKEHTLIVKAYTELFGLQSYIVHGVRSAGKKRMNPALFEPLQLLDMVVYHKKTREIQRLTEARICKPYQSLSHEADKQIYLLVMAELLLRITEAYDEQRPLDPRFRFLSDSLYAFDALRDGYSIFFFQFCVKLSQHLGLAIGRRPELHARLEAAQITNPTPIAKTLWTAYQSPYQPSPALLQPYLYPALQFLLKEYEKTYPQLAKIRKNPYLKDLF